MEQMTKFKLHKFTHLYYKIVLEKIVFVYCIFCEVP